MSKQVIEYGGQAVGVVVPEAGRLKFIAVKYSVWDLDSRRYHSLDEVRAAIRNLMVSAKNRQMESRQLPDSSISAVA
ncbi:hypothetical protein [Pararhizobium gei]|uniref:hypothetical protein n=1 Tax=Pararhizobium gei TaxID=1395951 RepID=UPI0023DB2F06|nr:hypothetical protein [Rhizobium gei]